MDSGCLFYISSPPCVISCLYDDSHEVISHCRFDFISLMITAVKHFFHLHIGHLGYPCGSAGKESACNEGDLGSIPRLGRSSGEGKGYPLQYSGLENSKDCIVHGVTKRWTWLSDFHFTSLTIYMILSINIFLNRMINSLICTFSFLNVRIHGTNSFLGISLVEWPK